MTAKRSTGADAPDTTPFMLAIMPNPALQSFAAGQRFALEAARFWARRMHACANQMETLAHCSTPDDFARAQTQFFERLREDYAEEGKTLASLVTPHQDEAETRKI